MRILYVEDDQNLGIATSQGLKTSYAVDWVTSAEDAEDALGTTQYALMVLDINLPGMSGLEFLRQLRGKHNNIPVLLLTARDTVQQKIEGLNSGSDDYLVKPFDLNELLARCAALTRRLSQQDQTIIEHKKFTYEPATKHVTQNNKPVALSAKELAIFDYLARNIDRTISKDKITEAIYDWSSEEIESNTIEVHIASIRRKMGKDLIKTIRGVGYTIPK